MKYLEKIISDQHAFKIGKLETVLNQNYFVMILLSTISKIRVPISFSDIF